MKQYCTSEEDIETLFTYFQAAINGEENKESLKRLFDLQCGVMRSHPYQSEQFTKDELTELFLIIDSTVERFGKNTKVMKLLDKIEELRQAGSP